MKSSLPPLLLLAACTHLAFLGDARAEKAPADPAAGDNPTAYSALRRVKAELGADILNHIVEVVGLEGVPQPYLWKITLMDPSNGNFREVDVADGKIAAQRTVARSSRPIAGSAISLHDLNLDSSGAFTAADTRARQIHLSFDALNYTLRADASTGKPVWSIQILNADHQELSTLTVAASDGSVINVTGRLSAAGEAASPSLSPSPGPPNATPATVTITPEEAQERAEGGLFERSGRTLDKTGKRVERSLRRAGASVERFFTGKSDLDKE